MSQITYKAKDGRLMEVGDWETVRRSILERSGWALVEEPQEVEAEPETVEEPTPAAPKPAPKKQAKKATKAK
jgi:hypothetical protein